MKTQKRMKQKLLDELKKLFRKAAVLEKSRLGDEKGKAKGEGDNSKDSESDTYRIPGTRYLMVHGTDCIKREKKILKK